MILRSHRSGSAIIRPTRTRRYIPEARVHRSPLDQRTETRAVGDRNERFRGAGDVALPHRGRQSRQPRQRRRLKTDLLIVLLARVPPPSMISQRNCRSSVTRRLDRSRGSVLKWREAFTAIVLAAGETTTLKSDPACSKNWRCGPDAGFGSDAPSTCSPGKAPSASPFTPKPRSSPGRLERACTSNQSYSSGGRASSAS